MKEKGCLQGIAHYYLRMMNLLFALIGAFQLLLLCSPELRRYIQGQLEIVNTETAGEWWRLSLLSIEFVVFIVVLQSIIFRCGTKETILVPETLKSIVAEVIIILLTGSGKSAEQRLLMGYILCVLIRIPSMLKTALQEIQPIVRESYKKWETENVPKFGTEGRKNG